MPRFVLSLTVICALLPGVGQAQSVEDGCAIQGQIFQAVVDQRIKGVSAKRAERAVTNGLTEAVAAYKPIVPVMVAYVYDQVEQAQLSDTAGDQWKTQCVAAAKG